MQGPRPQGAANHALLTVVACPRMSRADLLWAQPVIIFSASGLSSLEGQCLLCTTGANGQGELPRCESAECDNECRRQRKEPGRPAEPERGRTNLAGHASNVSVRVESGGSGRWVDQPHPQGTYPADADPPAYLHGSLLDLVCIQSCLAGHSGGL